MVRSCSGRETPFRILFAAGVLILLVLLMIPENTVIASGNPWNEGGNGAEIAEADQESMNAYARKVNSVIREILKDFYAILQGIGAILLVVYFLEFGISINASEPPNRYLKGIASALLFLIAPTILAVLA